jgi:hypothetical protein
MKFLKRMFFVLGAVKGAEEENTEVETDLTKSLDENLKAMEDLKKSKVDDESFKELMKDKKSRKKMKEMMDEYEKDDEDDDDEDMDDKDDDDKGKKKKKGMKKSLEDSVEENEDVIDAVPVLKSFVTTLNAMAEKMETLEKSIGELKESQDVSQKFQKSMANVVESEAKLVKSMNDMFTNFGKRIPAPKGVIGKNYLLNKSFGNEQQVQPKYNREQVRVALLKSFEDKEISSKVVSVWEMSGYNTAAIPAREMAIIQKNLPKLEA